eukprot:gene55696-76332_t
MLLVGLEAQPNAVIVDSRSVQSTPASEARAGYGGAKRRQGAKVHAVVAMLGHLLASRVKAVKEQARSRSKMSNSPIHQSKLHQRRSRAASRRK